MSLPGGFRLPGDRADLERRITAWSRSVGLPEGWLRRYIATSVVLAMLGRARDAGGDELFIAKGGASKQLRFGTAARLTRDLDAAFRGREGSPASQRRSPRHSPSLCGSSPPTPVSSTPSTEIDCTPWCTGTASRWPSAAGPSTR